MSGVGAVHAATSLHAVCVHAVNAGSDEEAVLSCISHDIGVEVARPDHGWLGAQLIEPHVSDKVTGAVRHRQAPRSHPDSENAP
jgi:predicted HD phosphohydrolase